VNPGGRLDVTGDRGGAGDRFGTGEPRPGNRARAQTHSQESLGDGWPMLALKILPHRRRPVPMAQMGPGLRREDEEGDAAVIHLDASEH